ncbi:hypothetical protein A4R26_20480 [Niastella populi]|uniref:2Fe-2S ferredoxin-type domain-containing protein n=1 Tax=Niastella populi TaxID=550983 RepID=A0A1V9FN40_9BACT|nr:hypothetical protein A4R26_20480 [Niastella populi]
MINFTIHFKGKVYRFCETADQYESLLSLICDHFYVKCFGVCYGGGCCGTCGVFVVDTNGNIKLELSCEIRINELLNNKIIIIDK